MRPLVLALAAGGATIAAGLTYWFLIRVPSGKGRLVVVVKDYPTGDPIRGASVSIDTVQAGATDAAGQVSFDVDPGEYDVSASAIGYQPSSTVAVVRENKVVTVTIRLSTTGPPPPERYKLEIFIRGPMRLKQAGRELDLGNQPLDGAMVKVSGPMERTVVSVGGWARIDNLLTGTYSLEITHPSEAYEIYSGTINLDRDITDSVALDWIPGTALPVRELYFDYFPGMPAFIYIHLNIPVKGAPPPRLGDWDDPTWGPHHSMARVYESDSPEFLAPGDYRIKKTYLGKIYIPPPFDKWIGPGEEYWFNTLTGILDLGIPIEGVGKYLQVRVETEYQGVLVYSQVVMEIAKEEMGQSLKWEKSKI